MSDKPEGQLSLTLTSSSADSRARTSQSPDGGRDSTAPARASRTNTCAWSPSSSPDSWSSRTSTRDGADGCPNCGAACGPDGMPACRFDCPPLKLARPIGAFDASLLGGELLPTPTAARYGSGQNGDPRDGRGRYAQKGKPSLYTRAARGLLPDGGRGPLHPRFVEWMMGLPQGWTDVD